MVGAYAYTGGGLMFLPCNFFLFHKGDGLYFHRARGHLFPPFFQQKYLLLAVNNKSQITTDYNLQEKGALIVKTYKS